MSLLSRRSLLVGTTLTAAGLLVPIVARPVRSADGNDETSVNITDWIMIATTGQVTLGLSQPEVGQGSYTALPAILADELDADWPNIAVMFVTGKDAYRIAFKNEAPVQKEGASMSTTVLYSRLRQAGATARDVMIRAAAQRWGVEPAVCRTANGACSMRAGISSPMANLPPRRPSCRSITMRHSRSARAST